MRVFAAIELNRKMKRALRKMTSGLAEFKKDVRWAKEEQIHLTLKFMGEVADQDVAQVCDVCEEVAGGLKPFPLVVERCGCFPSDGKVRVIWGGGLDSVSAELADCVRRLEDGLATMGFDRERRPFSAHMTIGRVRVDRSDGRLRKAAEGLKVSAASQMVDGLTVFDSSLHSSGAEHTALARYSFGSG